MTSLLPIALLLLTAFVTHAQTVITGKVKDNRGRGIHGASIAIKDSYDGATADSLGNFRFRTAEKGEHIILITAVGYKLYEQKVTFNGTPVTLDIPLKAEPNELTAVVITAGTFEASDTKRTTVLNPIDIVTTAGANGDITGAIKTLPGAQQVGESEGLFVRGGTAQETKIFIDGTLVNNFFLSSVPGIASRGRFNPFIFKGTVFSSGGYSALYGQALSSALILESTDLPDQSSANFGVSTVGLSAGFQQLSKKKNASWSVNYSYTNLAAYFAVVKQRPDNFQIPEFHNGEGSFRIKTSKTGMLKFYGYYNYSRLGLRRPNIDSVNLKDAFYLTNYNVYANLAWKEKLGKNWRLNMGLSYSNNKDRIANELQNQDNEKQFISYDPFSNQNFNVTTNAELTNVKVVLERKLYGLSAIRFGGEYFYFNDRNDYSNQWSGKALTTTDDQLKAAFAEADIYLTNDLAAKIGSRYEHSTQLEKANIVPRASLAYKTGAQSQISLAYGLFYQKPEKDYFLRGYTHQDLVYTRATHYIANYQTVSRDYTLRVEAYYKKYHELVKTYAAKGNTSGIPDSVANGGYGDAKGIEVFWRDRKTLKNVDYWISYSYLDTKRDFLNYPYAIQPNFAANHTASLVVKKFVTKWKTGFNASYQFATGRPYYNIRYDKSAAQYKIFDEGKTIAYHNLSFSLNYLPHLGKTNSKKFVVWVFSINNVIGNNQVFGYNYSYNGLRKEPILPTARRFFFLGCFFSFGVDNTQDVINSNL